MFRTLLVIEDYNELVYLGGVLRKIGFDLETVQTTAKYAEFMLSLNPQVLIISSSGKKVDLALIQKDLKKRQRPPKTVLLINPTQNIEDLPMMDVDVILSSPVKIDKLIDSIADQLGIDPAPYLTKFNRLSMAGNEAAESRDPLKDDLQALNEFQDSLQVVKGGGATKTAQQTVKGSSALTEETSLVSGSADFDLKSDNVNQTKNSVLQKTLNEDSFDKSTSSTLNESQRRTFDTPLATNSQKSNAEQFSLEQNKLSTDSKQRAKSDGTFASNIGSSDNIDVSQPITTKIEPSKLSSAEREQRFKKLLSESTLPKDAKFSREMVAANNKALRTEEKKTSLFDLEEERKKFVKKMFSDKNKKS